MTLHQHLPIYKLAVDLLDLAVDLTRNMPRDFKASLGAEIRSELIRLICTSPTSAYGNAMLRRPRVPMHL